MMSLRVSRSTAAPREIPPDLDRVRLASVSDAPHILAMCTESMKKTFRVYTIEEIEYLIKNCVLAVVQINVKEDVVGALFLREYPVIPSIDPSAWEEYVWAKYKTIELNARNTIWIHLLCWYRLYSRELVDSMLKSVYMHDIYLHYICMIKSDKSCPQLVPGTSRTEGAFRRVQAMERGIPGDQLPALLIADRKELCPRLRVRRAVEEDNDDIVPIIDRHSERLREMYGDFYISELISRHPESERVLLVCEHKELAVGIMCLNTQINFQSLEECFELSPYAGLRHLDQPPHKHRNGDDAVSVISDGNVDGFDNSIYQLETMSIGMSTDTVNKKDNKNTESVTWSAAEEPQTPADRLLYDTEGNLIGDVSVLQMLDLLSEDDEEDLEFDIVNIDPELMRVPYLMSSNDPVTKNVIDTRTKEDFEEIPKKDKKKSFAKVPEYIIRYSGASNAFLLELCAMHHDYDERSAFDMLEAAFEMFPGRDYCITCLPSNHPPFPLLEHFTLVAPHNTRMRFINESLYVAHVNSVKGDVSVRPGEWADMRSMYDLLEHSGKRDSFISLFEEALSSRVLKTFMLLSQKQPIGVIVIGPLEDDITIRSQYNLEPEPRWPLGDGNIIGGTLSPIMEPHARWYLRDMMRQSRYCTFFWICQPFAKGESCPLRHMMSLTERMIPVKPRSSLPFVSGSRLIDRLLEDLSAPFALWTIERPTTSYPKINVNSSIVVVGASRAGLAFIEALILGETSKYLTFTNLTLVSENGLPTVAEGLKAADIAIPQEGRYSDHYLKCIPLCFYVDVITAAMVEIDRKKKCIYLSTGGLKFYDDLVITCGQQFQHPDYLKESLEKVKEVRKGKPCVRTLMDDPSYLPDRVPPAPPVPVNLFLINSLLHANLVFTKLLLMLAENRGELTDKNRIVVYGDCLEAYCCIAALLELGLTGRDIAFVENYPPEDFTALRVNCFNDEYIDERIQTKMEDLGIRCYRKCRISKLHIHHKHVNAISLMAPLCAIHIDCYALFYYGIKAININAFKAINECGLVYDGGLVVGPMFETNDPNIFGAGTCCNYSRRLYAADHNHKYYNSEEVGESLAEIFLHRFDPFITCHPDYNVAEVLPRYSVSLYSRSHASIPEVSPSRLYLTQQPLGRGWQPVMKFASPIVKSATLPGPFYYMKVRKPGPDVPMEVQLTLPHQGHTLVTNKFGNYFRLRLNVLHCVDAVTCLSKDPFCTEILAKLYGKHEAYFNKLLLRYQLEQIEDLYGYFKQPWMSALYQETFDELMENIGDQEVGSVLDTIKSKYAMMGDKPSKTSTSRLSSKSSRMVSVSTCFNEPLCEEEHPRNGNLRDVIYKYARRHSFQLERNRGPSDIPTECGQSAEMRDEIAAFWDTLGGERIVQSHIGYHVEKYAVPNPQYAPPDPEYYRQLPTPKTL